MACARGLRLVLAVLLAVVGEPRLGASIASRRPAFGFLILGVLGPRAARPLLVRIVSAEPPAADPAACRILSFFVTVSFAHAFLILFVVADVAWS